MGLLTEVEFGLCLLDNVGILNLDSQFLQSLVFQWINTGILCIGLYWLLYKPAKQFMAKRTDRIQGQITSAISQLDDAEALKTEYQKKLQNIENERNEMLNNARIRIEKQEQQIIEKAQQEVQVLKDRAMLDIEREKDKAQDEMKQEMVAVASIMARRYIENSMDAAMQARLLDEAINELGDTVWPN